MALDESAFYSTPAEYATPLQLRSVREYAKALLQGKKDYPYVGNPMGAAASMIDALRGGQLLGDTGRSEMAGYDARAAAVPLKASVGMPGGVQVSEDDTTEPPAAAPRLASPAPIAPATPKDKLLAYGQRQLAALGEGPTPDTVPDGKPPPTGSMFEGLPGWAPGERPIDAGDAPDGATGAPALAFDAEGGVAPNAAPDSPQRLAQALAQRATGGRAPAVAAPGTRAPTSPETGAPAPGTWQLKPRVSEGQLREIMRNPFMPPADRAAFLQMYYDQDQPVQVQGVGGVWNIPQGGRGKPQFVPTIGKATVEGKGAKYEERFTEGYDENGNLIQRIIPRLEAPRQPRGAPATAPSTSVPRIEPKAKSDVPDMDTPADTLLKYAPEQPGDLKSWLANPTGPMSAKPPTEEAVQVAEAAGVKPPTGAAGVKVAQGLPGKLRDMIEEGNELEFEHTTRTKAAEEEIKAVEKRYEKIGQAGLDSTKVLPQLQMARAVVDDPRFYSGPGSRFVLTLKQLQSKFGNNPAAAAQMELFQKLTSGAILGDMRAQLEGLGQVRVAEIDLLTKAMANLDYTQASNRAVLDLTIRANKQVAFLAKVAGEYKEGARWDENGKKYHVDTSTSAGRPTSAGLNLTLQRWAEKTALPKEDQKKYEEMFAGPAKPTKGSKSGVGTPLGVPPPKVIQSLPSGVTAD